MGSNGSVAGAADTRPKVLLIGGEDVDARIELMRRLAVGYNVAAAGTAEAPRSAFGRAGFPYFTYPLCRGLGPFSDARAVAVLWRLLRDFRPQIAHTFDTKPGVYGCLAARLAGVPLVVSTITGLGSLYDKSGLVTQMVRVAYESLQRLASRLADLTVFQNRVDREEFLARGIVPPEKSALIAGSGVATDAFEKDRIESGRHALRSALGIPANALVVTMVSRVIRSKGVEEFVAAARRIRDPRAHFLLVGRADTDSIDRFAPEEIKELAAAVQWLGPRNDVPQILGATDVFVLPTRLREGIPRVLLEAAAAGLPLVTSAAPGCSDVVEHDHNGYLVPPGDAPGLSQAIGKLLNDADLRQRFGRASRLRAVERFDLAVIAEQTRGHYERLLGNRLRQAPGAMARSVPLFP